MVQLLKVFDTVELHFLKSLSGNPFVINNRNMAGNIVEIKFFVVMNVKLEVKLRLKMFY